MDEKIFELSFEIIGYAGNAKGMAFEAISKAKAGNIDEARALLKESKDEVNNAHKCQTQLIQQEASGNKTDVSVVLIHLLSQQVLSQLLYVFDDHFVGFEVFVQLFQ